MTDKGRNETYPARRRYRMQVDRGEGGSNEMFVSQSCVRELTGTFSGVGEPEKRDMAARTMFERGDESSVMYVVSIYSSIVLHDPGGGG